MLRSMKDLERYAVRATDGNIGSVADFLFEDTSWRVRHLVVDTGGPLPRLQVLVQARGLAGVDYSAHELRLSLSVAEVEKSATVGADPPVSRQSGRPHPGSRDRRGEPAADPHLRSMREVIGYHVEGTDGPIGHVRDLVVDDETWAVGFMVIATANWWPGKSALISPQWATRISWRDCKVDVEMTRAAIKASPAWSATYPVDADYAEALARHYAGIPGWRGRDRSLEPAPARAPACDGACVEDLAVERANTRVAAHEEEQIRMADAAVTRDAREGRMP